VLSVFVVLKLHTWIDKDSNGGNFRTVAVFVLPQVTKVTKFAGFCRNLAKTGMFGSVRFFKIG
jgi:hypothetical protein